MIFLDSTYLIGILFNRDKYNQRAKKIRLPSGERKLINNVVLNEVLNTLNEKDQCDAELLHKYILSMPYLEIVYLTPKDYLNAIKKSKYYGNSINYSDCLILETMEQYDVSKIITFDSDFKKIKRINVIDDETYIYYI